MKKLFVLAVLIMLIVLGMKYLADDSADTESDGLAKSTDVVANMDEINTDSAEQVVKEFTVVAKNFSFEPKEIKVKMGNKVRIVLDNTDGFHDLKIDEFAVATKRLKAGEKDAIEFMADKSGTFEYYCSVGEHRAMGMKGQIVVE